MRATCSGPLILLPVLVNVDSIQYSLFHLLLLFFNSRSGKVIPVRNVSGTGTITFLAFLALFTGLFISSEMCSYLVRFQLLMAANIKMIVCWDVTQQPKKQPF